jgi:hypothetical protein
MTNPKLNQTLGHELPASIYAVAISDAGNPTTRDMEPHALILTRALVGILARSALRRDSGCCSISAPK